MCCVERGVEGRVSTVRGSAAPQKCSSRDCCGWTRMRRFKRGEELRGKNLKIYFRFKHLSYSYYHFFKNCRRASLEREVPRDDSRLHQRRYRQNGNSTRPSHY